MPKSPLEQIVYLGGFAAKQPKCDYNSTGHKGLRQSL